MKFIFKCSNRYLTSERSKRVGYRFEHEKINFISPSNHVIFYLLYKPTNYDVFDDFLKISDHFPKISEDLQNVVQRSYECFRTFSELFRKFPKIAEEDRKMFRPTCNIDLLWLIQHWNRANLSENVSKSISPHVKIHVIFMWKISWYFTEVYIIKCTFESKLIAVLKSWVKVEQCISMQCIFMNHNVTYMYYNVKEN